MKNAVNENWRLIPLLETRGKQQMALDRWLLQQHRQGKHPPALRFYTWSPVAISLGYHQRQWPESWQTLTWQGQPVDLVKRPSGGRAVLHQGDLTYMVVTSGLKGDRLQVYEAICEFLIQGFRSLGVELNYGTVRRVERTNPNCFSLATGADLVLPGGAKLIGSAQLRSGEAILQHGSIQLEPDPLLFSQVFGEEALAKVGSVDDFPKSLPRDRQTLIQTLISALVNAASDRWGAKFQTKSISEAEWQEIRAIAPEQETN